MGDKEMFKGERTGPRSDQGRSSRVAVPPRSSDRTGGVLRPIVPNGTAKEKVGGEILEREGGGLSFGGG